MINKPAESIVFDIIKFKIDSELVIEIIDTEEKINTLLPLLDEMMQGGLITMEKVRVIDYRSGENKDSHLNSLGK